THQRDLHSFPTRRSSDLKIGGVPATDERAIEALGKKRHSHGERAEVQQPCPRMAPATAGYFPAGDLHFTGPIGFVFQREVVEVRSEEHTSELQSLRHLVC